MKIRKYEIENKKFLFRKYAHNLAPISAKQCLSLFHRPCIEIIENKHNSSINFRICVFIAWQFANWLFINSLGCCMQQYFMFKEASVFGIHFLRGASITYSLALYYDSYFRMCLYRWWDSSANGSGKNKKNWQRSKTLKPMERRRKKKIAGGPAWNNIN